MRNLVAKKDGIHDAGRAGTGAASARLAAGADPAGHKMQHWSWVSCDGIGAFPSGDRHRLAAMACSNTTAAVGASGGSSPSSSGARMAITTTRDRGPCSRRYQAVCNERIVRTWPLRPEHASASGVAGNLNTV